MLSEEVSAIRPSRQLQKELTKNEKKDRGKHNKSPFGKKKKEKKKPSKHISKGTWENKKNPKPYVKPSFEKLAEFDSVKFIMKHFRMLSWTDFCGLEYTEQEMHGLLDNAIAVLQHEKSAVKVSPGVTICGDLCGSLHDLVRILNMTEGQATADKDCFPFTTQRFVFLGNYTETGRFNLETLCLLLGLKVLYPSRYTLLCGYQESDKVRCKSYFQREIRNRFRENDVHVGVWEKIVEVYTLLPLCAVVGDRILCVHSGISSEAPRVDMLKKIPRTSTPGPMSSLALDILNACPLNDDATGADSLEPMYSVTASDGIISKFFNAAAVKTFCAKSRIDLIVRGHDIPPNGFRMFANEKMITIFSVADYNGYKNKAAILKVSKAGEIEIIQMKRTEREVKGAMREVGKFPSMTADEIGNVQNWCRKEREEREKMWQMVKERMKAQEEEEKAAKKAKKEASKKEKKKKKPAAAAAKGAKPSTDDGKKKGRRKLSDMENRNVPKASREILSDFDNLV